MVSHFFTSKMLSLKRSAQAALWFHTASVRTCFWWRRCSNFLLLFKPGGGLLMIEFFKFFICTGYRSFVRYVFGKHILQVCGLSSFS